MSESVDVIVTVPHGDGPELAGLTRDLSSGSSPIEARSLDGATTAAVLLAVTTSSLPVLRAWLLARLDAKRGSIVSFDGVKLQGYSAAEVERIVSVIRQELGDNPSDSSEAT
jgi:hypothetical protein